jgi:hypothetical protein
MMHGIERREISMLMQIGIISFIARARFFMDTGTTCFAWSLMPNEKTRDILNTRFLF